LGTAPCIVGNAEVDQINIISRWIHHHSNDRAFFPFPQSLADEVQRTQFVAQICASLFHAESPESTE
jgi:DNA polymerase-3 subunit epsilon